MMIRVMTKVCLPLALRLKFDFDLWQGLGLVNNSVSAMLRPTIRVCAGLGLCL